MASSPDSSPANDSSLPIHSLYLLLHALADVIRGFSPSDYDCTPANVPGATSSAGGHVRHCLDHVRALLDGLASGQITYDRRQRDTRIEHDRDLAVAASRDLASRLSDVSCLDLEQEVKVEVTISSTAPPRLVGSTLAREFGFVISHSVHHHALIGIIATSFGVDVPKDFVYAPATLAWLKGTSCAPSP